MPQLRCARVALKRNSTLAAWRYSGPTTLATPACVCSGAMSSRWAVSSTRCMVCTNESSRESLSVLWLYLPPDKDQMCVFLLPRSFDCFKHGGRQGESNDLLVLVGPVYIRYVYVSIHVSFISVIYSVQPMYAPARVAQFMDKPLQQFIDRT